MARGGEEREQRRAVMNAFHHKRTASWSDRIYIYHIIFSVKLSANKQRLAAELIHVKHVVITHVQHECAPSGPALRALLGCSVITGTTLPLSGRIISPSGQTAL